jgi:aminoglycoside phosphotransferase (APT) family kinase protein
VTEPLALERRLAPWLAPRLGAREVEVAIAARHTEGFSWQTYTIVVHAQGAPPAAPWTEQLVVRVQPPDGVLAPYDIESQYRVLVAVQDAPGVPVPAVRWLETSPAVLGQPFFVMEHVGGDVPVQWQPDDRTIFPTPDGWHRFGQRFADVHAAIHELDWRARGLGEPADIAGDARASVDRQLNRWIEAYERSRIMEIPVLRQAIEWLRHNLPVPDRLVLCHGDYRIGNVMARAGELVAVLDWELAHVGDPIEDLAYAGLPLWRGRDERISHLLLPEEYFARYTARTGTAVDPAAYRAWTIFGLLKAGAVHLRGARAFEDGRTNDLRLAALGHQVGHVARHLTTLLAAATA